MKIIAIDTSTSVMGVALLDENKVYGEMITNLKKNHSVRLMPIVDQLFREIGWKPEEIELVAVSKGPGSYTGVRIGVTTAKTFSWAMGKPLVGISTIEAMAYSQSHFNGVISPIIDARRGQVYTGLYQWSNQEFSNLEKDRIVLLTDWIDNLKELKQPVIFVGDDLILHQSKIKEELGAQVFFANVMNNIPRPSAYGLLALERFNNGTVDNTFDFVPAYLQLPEAEVKWLEKQKS